MKLLMCRPDFFGIEYEINPWMHLDNRVDPSRAQRQWQALHDLYVEMGQSIEVVKPVPGLPDMVFTANSAVIWQDKVVLSHFHHPERQGEEPYYKDFFTSRGMQVHELDRSLSQEGAGDFLFVGGRLFAGFGFRTERQTHEVVAAILGVDVISLELVDAHYYHLDTCFTALDDRTVLINPDAFTPASLAKIHANIERVVGAPADVAAGFACNAFAVGDTVVSSPTIENMRAQLGELGFQVKGLDMSEFMKAGGGVRCLTLPLEVGVTARRS